VNDWRGTNIVVSRSPDLSAILAAGNADGSIVLDSLDVEKAVQSQSGNFRHRREGLSVRLEAAAMAGIRTPKKRIHAGSFVASRFRKDVVNLRQYMAERSHIAYYQARSENNIPEFFREMSGNIRKMENIYHRHQQKTMKYWIKMPFRLFKKIICMATLSK
jgi:hypothetical protein